MPIEKEVLFHKCRKIHGHKNIPAHEPGYWRLSINVLSWLPLWGSCHANSMTERESQIFLMAVLNAQEPSPSR